MKEGGSCPSTCRWWFAGRANERQVEMTGVCGPLRPLPRCTRLLFMTMTSTLGRGGSLNCAVRAWRWQNIVLVCIARARRILGSRMDAAATYTARMGGSALRTLDSTWTASLPLLQCLGPVTVPAVRVHKLLAAACHLPLSIVSLLSICPALRLTTRTSPSTQTRGPCLQAGSSNTIRSESDRPRPRPQALIQSISAQLQDLVTSNLLSSRIH